MNNIEQKNVIYNLSVNSELPYQKANQVSLKANQIIYTAINHALDKMVDNDLYNEKAIFSNASYVQGPKPEADVDIAIKADGYKMWPTSISSPESDLSILHKNVLTLQQSLSAIELDSLASIGNVRVSSIVHGKPGYLVIAKYQTGGEWQGKAFVTTNINDPTTLKHVNLDTGVGSPWPLDAVEIDGTIYILMSNGVRKVVSSTFDGIGTIETADVIAGVDNPTSFKIHDGKYVVGNATGILTYLDDGKTLVRAVDENVAVNDIASVGEFALAATDNGIYKSDVKYTFYANEIVLDTGVIPKFTYLFGSNVFVATNKGLHVLDGNKLTLIGNVVNVAAICEFNGKLYVGYEDSGGVCQVNVGSTISTMTLSSVSIFDKLSIKGLASYNGGEMLVATVASDKTNGIFYATPMLQKLYPIDATQNSTLATSQDGDAFVTNKNIVHQVSKTDATFFELVKNDEWNVKQFAGDYAIDAQTVYILGSDGHYVEDMTFDVVSGTDATLNGIQEVSTSYGKIAYIVYGKSAGPCIQASINGIVLKYNGITNVNVTSVFNLSDCVVVVVNDEAGSTFYVIPALTFFNVDKCSVLTLADFYSSFPEKTVTSIAVGRKHAFYVDSDGKLYSATIVSIGKLDKGNISKYAWLSSSSVENIHQTYIQNDYGNQVDIVCWNNTRGGSISASTYVTDDSGSGLSSYVKPFGIKCPFKVDVNAQDADIFDFLMEFSNPTDEDIEKKYAKNDCKHFGAQYMGSHSFIAASSAAQTVISSIDGVLTFDNLDRTDKYFAPYEHLAAAMSTTPFTYSYANNTLPTGFTFNETTADKMIRRYDPMRQLDENGNVARYEIIGNGHGLSALHLSPSYQQFTPTTTNLVISNMWVMPLDRNFMYDSVVSSGITNYPACIDVAFAGKGPTTATAKNSGIWHLKQHDEFDAAGAWTQKWTQIIQTTTDVIDMFSYKMSIDHLGDDTSISSCTYSLIAYSNSGVSSFDYRQQPVDESDKSFTLSTGNVKSLFSGNNIKHVSINSTDDSLLYVLSGDEPISGYGIPIVDVKNKKTIISPALSTGIFAFDIVQASAIVATENNLCVIANFSTNVSADSIPASDISAIQNVDAKYKYTSSKKFYCCAADNELTEFAVFYNNNRIAIWSNDTHKTNDVYSLKTFSTTTNIASLQLNEGRHNYLPSITYSDGKNTIDVIQSININKSMNSDQTVVEWLQKTVEVGTANINQMNAYAYVYDVYFFGGAVIWADATTPTSKLFYPDYQLSVTPLNGVPSGATIRNIAVDQRYLEKLDNGGHKSIAQVFIATTAGLYYDCLSVSMGTTTTTVNTYSRKELRQFKPHIPTGNLSELAALSAANICSVNTYNNILYIAVYTASTDPEFPYYIYSASLAGLDNNFDTYKVALNLEFKVPKGEAYDTIKLCTAGGMNCVCAKRSSSTRPPEVYNFVGESTFVETDLSSVIGSTATTVFQGGDIPFKADSNGLSAISADGSSYTLAKVGSGNPGKVLTMSYSDDQFYASGSKGLSSFTIDKIGDLSSIPELADYSLCANNGLDAFSLSGELSGVYIPQTHPQLSVVSSLKFPNTLSNIQMANDAGIQYVYATDSNSVSSFQAVSRIQTQTPTTYVFNRNKVKKMFSNNEFVQVADSANSLVKTSNSQTLDKPCTTINYIGDNCLFGAEGTTPKAYQYLSTTDQLMFSKILGLPASYQFLSAGDDVMLVAGATGVSALDMEDAIAGRWSAAVSQTDISTSTQCLAIDQTNVDKWTGKVTQKVLAGTATTILSSENAVDGYAKSNFLTLPSDVYSIFPVDSYTYLIGTKQKGLYFTSYRYAFSDDLNTIPFSVIDQKIRDAYLMSIQEHIEGYHQSDSSISYINNNVMPVDASKISDAWQMIDLGNSSSPDLTTNYKVIENDIVESIDYGDVIQHIKVEYSNILTRGYTTIYKDVSTEMSIEISGRTPTGDISTEISTWTSVTTSSELSIVDRFEEVDGVSYINKRWKSGLIDLFINIPTTNTYYFPHTLANDPCYYNTDKIKRKNFSDSIIGNDLSSGNIDDAATTFKVTLYKKYFGQINNIINFQLDAQTLPLKIYKDTTYDDTYSNFFHSCIMPSIVLGQELYSDKIVIKCKCFGSDAQALHILADSYRVLYITFDKNSATATEDMSDIQYARGDKLPECTYINNGYVFQGWAKDSTATVPDYKPNSVIEDFYEISTSKLTLYAVWKKYEFGPHDTIIKLKKSSPGLQKVTFDKVLAPGTTVVVDFTYPST